MSYRIITYMTSVALALRTVMFTANEGECVDIFLRKMRLQPANINSLVNIAFLDPDSTVRKHRDMGLCHSTDERLSFGRQNSKTYSVRIEKYPFSEGRTESYARSY